MESSPSNACKNARQKARLLPVAALLLLCPDLFAATPVAPTPQLQGLGAVDDIQAAATEARSPTGARPLPLASSWATGMLPDGFSPDWQLAMIAAGHRLLPWVQLAELGKSLPASYFEPALQELAKQRLPLTLVSTQWDVAVAQASSSSPGIISKLSPLSSMSIWYEAGQRWSRHPMLARMQELYPNPPRVILLSNNEQPKLGWQEVRDQGLLPAGLSDEEIRRRVGDAWIARYRELLRGFRDGLTAPAWRANAKFVGYDAFGFVDYFRWSGWLEYSLSVPERFEPWPLAWDGSSATYYTHDWSTTTDFQVFSPQVGAGNLVPMTALAEQMRTDYWFELSIWDGQQPGNPQSKELVYRSMGQTYDPARYEGFVQFGMWLTRPRVMREFRNPDQTRSSVGQYFDAVMRAVDRVHDQPVLQGFWRSGRLLANDAQSHPYLSSVPAEWQSRARWFMLESSANPPRPWSLDTELKVFAIALQLGNAPRREWLVYAHSPLTTTAVDSQLQIPGGPRVTLRSTRSGCFTHLRESGMSATTIGC